MADLLRLPLHDLHLHHGARMVPFAGYEMPVQYNDGVMKEHLHTRSAVGLFDVSHMGQIVLRPLSGRLEDAAAVLETLLPIDVLGLQGGRQRYGYFTNQAGGILDDLMVANREDHLFVVVNAACKDMDVAHMQAHLAGTCAIEVAEERALLALQGPMAQQVLSGLVDGVTSMRFMDVITARWGGTEIWISRSGYTGEDGFEISVPATHAPDLATALLAVPQVSLVGLGARDSLRLEVGMPLYGHDINIDTTPVEAGLGWAIQKVRRKGGAREGGFPGAARILAELEAGAPRRRVGLRPQGRAPMREGTSIYASPGEGDLVGQVTSGGFGPSIEAPIAMCYLPSTIPDGATVWGEVRGKRLPAKVCSLPFRSPTYKR